MADVSVIRDIYITGLKNVHAMEKQALAIMQPQLNRLTHYPELSQRLAEHIRETEAQIERVDQALEQVQSKASSMKDVFLSTFGSMAALGHAMTGDEVLKNSFANLAFENYEIAAYTSLITMARASGQTQAIGLLQQNLDEELHMASWILNHLPEVTETYIFLRDAGQKAKI